MQEIGDQMQDRTRGLGLASNREGNVNILDICMAPGGFTAALLSTILTQPLAGLVFYRSKEPRCARIIL